jgi:hypothetical protein
MASDSYQLTGPIKVIFETQSIGAKGFRKREFVVTVPGKYPQDIKLQATKDNCDRLDNLRVGQEIEVSFNLRGNEHNGKYYVTVEAWKITAKTMHPPDRGDAMQEHERNRERLRNPQPARFDDDSDGIDF